MEEPSVLINGERNVVVNKYATALDEIRSDEDDIFENKKLTTTMDEAISDAVSGNWTDAQKELVQLNQHLEELSILSQMEHFDYHELY